jgi:uncharacterized coiled-coil protein SlyX
MDDRLTRVEEKIAYLEKFVTDLDGVVQEMHEALGAVRRDVGTLRAQLERQSQEEDGSDDLEAQKPPHY